jgi:hypothetical protein
MRVACRLLLGGGGGSHSTHPDENLALARHTSLRQVVKQLRTLVVELLPRVQAAKEALRELA